MHNNNSKQLFHSSFRSREISLKFEAANEMKSIHRLSCYLLSTIATGSGRRVAASFHFADFRLPILACETNIRFQMAEGRETNRTIERKFEQTKQFLVEYRKFET